MLKLIVSVEMSLDGVEENPQDFVFDFWDKENEQYAHDLLLIGWVSYEGLTEAWLGMAGQDAFADRMNSLPKLVSSRTLQEPLKWNASLFKGDLKQAVTELKQQQPGKDILQYGIGELTLSLLEYGLVDDIRPLIYPMVMGKGGHIFEKIDKTALKLLGSRTFESGVVALRYAP